MTVQYFTGSATMNTYLVPGSPYMTFEYSGATPKFTSGQGLITSFANTTISEGGSSEYSSLLDSESRLPVCSHPNSRRSHPPYRHFHPLYLRSRRSLRRLHPLQQPPTERSSSSPTTRERISSIPWATASLLLLPRPTVRALSSPLLPSPACCAWSSSPRTDTRRYSTRTTAFTPLALTPAIRSAATRRP